MPMNILFSYLFLFQCFIENVLTANLGGAAYRKLKATREGKERKCAVSWFPTEEICC